VPQVIVIIEILIAKRDAKDPLPDERCDRMFNELRAPLVVKAARKSIYQPHRSIRRSEQKCAGVRRNCATIKSSNNFTSFYLCKIE
jgi:hypothetical protein